MQNLLRTERNQLTTYDNLRANLNQVLSLLKNVILKEKKYMVGMKLKEQTLHRKQIRYMIILH